jgi:hypothetical protein
MQLHRAVSPRGRPKRCGRVCVASHRRKARAVLGHSHQPAMRSSLCSPAKRPNQALTWRLPPLSLPSAATHGSTQALLTRRNRSTRIRVRIFFTDHQVDLDRPDTLRHGDARQVPISQACSPAVIGSTALPTGDYRCRQRLQRSARRRAIPGRRPLGDAIRSGRPDRTRSEVLTMFHVVGSIPRQ